MGKYAGYIEEIKKFNEEQEEQKKLHEKHNIVDENKIIIEKSNTFKFTVKMLTSLLKVFFSIVFTVLAGVGITTLCYPDVRNEFLKIVYEMMNLIGF